MKKLMIVTIFTLGAFCIAIYYYWQHIQSMSVEEPAPPPIPSQVPLPSKPVTRQVITPPANQTPLPRLADSDPFVIDALASVVGNPALMKIFHTDQIIHCIVATIDNLPGPHAPMSVMPFESARGKFITEKTNETLTIDQQNAERYTPYMRIAESIDPLKLVELYVRLYPLFQQSYEKLGYPGKYFNDRLMVTMDDLLAAPEIRGPIELKQPKYYYEYADPDLESRSVGQRILMRIGINNETSIKNKLREIKLQLNQHLHEITE